ncbi:MAG TPA: hypothetical protein DCR24_10150 [Bacillus bacterium]|nr:hypothetical protein [Bacillus sp. (in: firmicutes)]
MLEIVLKASELNFYTSNRRVSNTWIHTLRIFLHRKNWFSRYVDSPSVGSIFPQISDKTASFGEIIDGIYTR